jgi:hypothetical protein
MELCTSFQDLMQQFTAVFSRPCFLLWTTLMSGWVLSQRTRFVSDMIVSSAATRKGAWVNYYRFFNRYKWCLDELCQVLLSLIIKCLVPPHAVIVLAVDDTLCRKRGLGLFGVGMHHDPLISSKGKKLTSWGHVWVVVTVVIHGLPWAPDIAWSLPVGFRLYVNQQGVSKGKKRKAGKKTNGKKRKSSSKEKPTGHRTRPELAVELLKMIAAWFPHRTFLVTGDSLYGGRSVVGQLPPNMELISRAPVNAALYAPALPPPKKNPPGRPRKKGDRLQSIDEWANDPRSPWTTYRFDTYGLHVQMRWKSQDALYYTVGKSRMMKIILVEDLSGNRGRQVFFCTTTQFNVPFILRTYAMRWSIEVTFEDCKQLLGIDDPANRKQLAVQRTAPMAGVLHSLIVLWFNEVGHKHVAFPDRPWYRRKRTPSFGDMLTTLRRLSWEEKTTVAQKQGTLKTTLTQLIYFLSLAG